MGFLVVEVAFMWLHSQMLLFKSDILVVCADTLSSAVLRVWGSQEAYLIY